MNSALANRVDGHLDQAPLQQRLTGRTLLAGSHIPWEVKRLGELAKIQRGASPRPIDRPV